MLTYCRPHGSVTEGMFRRRYLLDLPGITEDAHGNLHVTIGASPILWSSHTDTVHRAQGMQTLRINAHEQTIRLSRASKRTSSCLGADDTVGVFLMREMILKSIPGHYIFHYGEECGGIGSGDLARKSPHLIDRHTLFAIALDRQGTSDVVTSQYGGDTASDTFAWSLAKQLPGSYRPAPGVYTDTAEYADIIPECSNISVGYYHQHSPREYVDTAHVSRLLDALCAIDADALICERDPNAPTHYASKWDNFYTADKPLWHQSPATSGALADSDWCYYCDAPIFDDTYGPRDSGDYCVCSEDDAYADLTDEDAKFLRYLRNR
jgi:hypothetical protein